MFEKNMRIAFLLDFYGDALDRRTNSIMRAYYEEDLSLAEIANGEQISRQGVRHLIKKGEDQLEFFETKLGLAAHYRELEDAVEKLKTLKQKLEGCDGTGESVQLLSEVINTILNKGI